MRTAVQYTAWFINVGLEILILWSLLRTGRVRKYPFIFAYVTTLVLTTAVEIAAFTAQSSGARQLARSPAFYYWVNEGVLQALLLCVVFALIYHATTNAPRRAITRAVVVAGAILFPTASFLIHHDQNAALSMWMTLWSRDLNFAAAVLDLALWAMLIGVKEKDYRLLMLSGGMGVQFAGEALGESLRQFSRATVWPGNLIIVFADITCLYVWWQTFRTAPEESGTALKEQVPPN